MKKNLLAVFIIIFSGCQPNDPTLTKDYISNLKLVSSIRDKFGYIPMKDIYDDFSISTIDFSGHYGIQKIGVKNLVLDKNEKSITIMIASDIEKFNKAVIEAIPTETGFQSSMILKDRSVYSVDWKRNGQSKVQLVDSHGKISQIFVEKDRTQDAELSIAFKLPVYVLFAVRELYYQFLINKMTPNFLVEHSKKAQTENVSARVSGAVNCEYYPSIYAEAYCGYANECRLNLSVTLNQKCWNTYCTGCCNKTFEPIACLGGITYLCLLVVYGNVCTGYQTGTGTGGEGTCKPNSPCPLPFDASNP